MAKIFVKLIFFIFLCIFKKMNRFFIAKKFFNQFYKKNYSVSNPEKLNSSKLSPEWKLYLGSCAYGFTLGTCLQIFNPDNVICNTYSDILAITIIPIYSFVATVVLIMTKIQEN